uniref:Uncharacterized protein n=1 Tax=Anguilla anguilla TaxID=7936 RepID=A0A0E9X0Y7_ANGAN
MYAQSCRGFFFQMQPIKHFLKCFFIYFIFILSLLVVYSYPIHSVVFNNNLVHTIKMFL